MLDIDPNLAVAGWLPLVLVLVVLLALGGLYLGMRHNMRVAAASVQTRAEMFAARRAEAAGRAAAGGEEPEVAAPEVVEDEGDQGVSSTS